MFHEFGLAQDRKFIKMNDVFLRALLVPLVVSFLTLITPERAHSAESIDSRLEAAFYYVKKYNPDEQVMKNLEVETMNRDPAFLLEDKQKRQVRPVLRIHNRVGKLSGLPDPAEWQERPVVKKRPPPPKPSVQSQLAVAEASQGLHDDELRLLLLRLVGATSGVEPAKP